MTMTLAPAPTSDAVISCKATDLPDPDLPKTATLWLPAAFSKGDQKKGCPRRPSSSRCGTGDPAYSPCIGAILATVVVSIVRMRFNRSKSRARPLAMVMGMIASRPGICM